MPLDRARCAQTTPGDKAGVQDWGAPEGRPYAKARVEPPRLADPFLPGPVTPTRAAPAHMDHDVTQAHALFRRAWLLQGRWQAVQELSNAVSSFAVHCRTEPAQELHWALSGFTRASCQDLKSDIEQLMGDLRAARLSPGDLGFC